MNIKHYVLRVYFVRKGFTTENTEYTEISKFGFRNSKFEILSVCILTQSVV